MVIIYLRIYDYYIFKYMIMISLPKDDIKKDVRTTNCGNKRVIYQEMRLLKGC